MRFIFISVLSFFVSAVFAQTKLAVPDTLSGSSIQLTMHKDSVQRFSKGPYSRTYSFNQYAYLGPTLIFNKNQEANITVNNAIDDTTSVHWHGMHVPAKMDGGPHTPIMPGASWNPQFKVMDHAATYWYHPHTHMKTTLQAIKGAAGFIIVRDSFEAALALPRTYGIDDFPIAVQCQQYDSMNQAMPLGMQDSTLLVNGARANNGFSVFVNVPAQCVRLRLLNASGERSFQFGLSGNKSFQIIGSDGGLLPQAISATRIRLSPGERAEIVINFSGLSGQTLYLMSYASELPMGVQGGPTMPMPSGPPMDSPLNGIDFKILTFNVKSALQNPILTIPTKLVEVPKYSLDSVKATRMIKFHADSDMVMDGPFYFSGKSFDMDRVDYTIPLGQTEKWKLVNKSMVAHPFHIHDVQFQIISRNGMPPAPEESGWKDVVLIPSDDSIEFITRFDDYADDNVPYMYHCHILMHEDAGMMGQFIVTKNKTSISTISKEAYKIYPNPCNNQLFVQFEISQTKPTNELELLSMNGECIQKFSRNENKIALDLSDLKDGMYVLKIKHSNGYSFEKIIHINE